MRPYALFDFDGTCIKGDSIVSFLKYSYCQKTLSSGELWKGTAAGLCYKLKRISSEKSKEIAFSFLKGKTWRELEEYGGVFCRECLLPKLRPEAVRVMQVLHEQGYLVLLVSASATFYLKELLMTLPIDGILGTELQLGADGRYNGKILGSSCRDEEKVLRISEYEKLCGEKMDAAQSIAFGDSASDYPMMKLCQRRVGINPKIKLRRLLSKDTKGEIRIWNEPGRMEKQA